MTRVHSPEAGLIPTAQTDGPVVSGHTPGPRAKSYSGSNKRRSPTLELDIGQALRVIRKRHGRSMGEMARELGVTFQAVQRFENGKSRVSLSTAIHLCRALQVSPQSLLEEVTLQTTTRAAIAKATGETGQ